MPFLSLGIVCRSITEEHQARQSKRKQTREESFGQTAVANEVLHQRRRSVEAVKRA
jgi:hypothetical protein